MHVDDLSRNGKTEPVPRLAREFELFDMAELFEEAFALFRGDARAGIADAHLKRVALRFGPNAYSLEPSCSSSA